MNREDSKCDHSDRLDEDFQMLSEAFANEGAEESCGGPLRASFDTRLKSLFNTESCVTKYNTLSQVLEKRTNPLLKDKGKIGARRFHEF